MAISIDKAQIDVIVNGADQLQKTDGYLARLADAFDGVRYKARILGANFQDMAVQLEMGTPPLRVLGQQLPEMMAAFGAFGAVLGGITAVAIPLAVLSYKYLGGEVRSFKQIVDDSSRAVKDFHDSQLLAMQSSQEMRLKYGDLANEAQRFYDIQTQLTKQLTFSEIGKGLTELNSRFSAFGEQKEKAFRSMGDTGISGDIFDITKRFAAFRLDVTVAQAEELAKKMRQVDANKPTEAVSTINDMFEYLQKTNTASSNLEAQNKSLVGPLKELQADILKYNENLNATILKTSEWNVENLKLQSSFLPDINASRRSFDLIGAARKEGALKIAEYEQNLNRNTRLSAEQREAELGAFKIRTNQDVADKIRDVAKNQQEAFYAQQLTNEAGDRSLVVQRQINDLKLKQIDSIDYQAIAEENRIQNAAKETTQLLANQELFRKRLIDADKLARLDEQAGSTRKLNDEISLQNITIIAKENERAIRIQMEGLAFAKYQKEVSLELEMKGFLLSTRSMDFSKKVQELRERQYQTEQDIQRNSKLSDEEKATALKNLGALYEENLKFLKQELGYRLAIDESYSAGAMDRLKQIQESFTPFKQGGMIVDSVFNQMGSAIDKFVETGKFSFSDFTRSIILDIEKILLKAAAINFLKAGASAMGFAIPGLASGGGVQGGSPYLVGEQGPELFIPSGAGNIIPNSRMSSAGGNTYITNNITAMDSKSVSQVFAENRMSLLGTVEQARRELPMRTR